MGGGFLSNGLEMKDGSSGDGTRFRVGRKTAQTGVPVLLGAEFGG